MKIKYFSYYLTDDALNYYRFDLRGFLEKFCDCKVPQFKKSFQHIDETIYLFNKGDGLFVIIKTKSDDILKKIDTNSLSFEDLKKMLAKDDRLGYAAYLYVQREYFAIASTMFSPKIRELQQFVSLVLQSLGIENNYFEVNLLTTSHDRSDILKENFIGASTITLGREGGVFEDIKNILLGRGLDNTDIGSFEVTIKPRRGRSIKREVVRVADNLASNEYTKFLVRAKDERTSILTDIYLDGSSAITDIVVEKDEAKILKKIKQSAETNNHMKSKALEAFNDEEIKGSTNNPNHVSIFDESWNTRINLYLANL